MFLGCLLELLSAKVRGQSVSFCAAEQGHLMVLDRRGTSSINPLILTVAFDWASGSKDLWQSTRTPWVEAAVSSSAHVPVRV